MGVGSAWGSREEFLHPRDSHGRFRNTWRMPQAAADAISKLLDAFNPRTFRSDSDAQTWIHNESRRSRFNTNRNSAIDNFVKGFSNVQSDARAGKVTPQMDQIDKGMQELPSDLILTKTVGPEAFGVDPSNIANIQELTGKLIHDKGYTSANIGTPNTPTTAGPHIQMTIATPKGTKAVIPQTSVPTSEVILPRDQNLRITKVNSDGRGGFYMMAVAVPGGEPGEKSTPLHEAPPSPAPMNLPEAPNATPSPQESAAPAVPTPEVAPSAPATPQAPVAPAAPTPVGTPGVPAPRAEPNVVEALHPGGAPVGAPQTPEVPVTPEASAVPVDLRAAVREADVGIPSAGKRRQQWNNAYLGVSSGKKHPEDALRELRSDIKHNRDMLEDDKRTGTDSGPLPGDIKAQEDLANLIEEKYGLGPAKAAPTSEPEKAAGVTKAVAKAAPSKRAVSAKKAASAKESSSGAPATAQEHRAKALDLLSTHEPDANKELVQRRQAEDHLRQADRIEKGAQAQARKAVKKAAPKKAAPAAAPSAPSAPETSEQRMARNARRVLDQLPESERKKIVNDLVPESAAQAGVPGEITDKTTVAQLRQIAKDRGIRIPSKLRTKAEIRAHIEGGGTSGGPGKPSVEDRVTAHLLDKLPEDVRNRVLADLTPADRKAVDDAVAKTAAEKASKETGAVTGEITDKTTVAQLRQIAKDRNLKVPSKLRTKAEIRKFIEDRGKGEGAADKARSRQAEIDDARKVADLSGTVHELIHNNASEAALRNRIKTMGKSSGVDVQPLLDSVGDKRKLNAELSRMEREAGITRVGTPGVTEQFRSALHEHVEGGSSAGPVEVVRPGFFTELKSGEHVSLSKARVTAPTSKEASKVTEEPKATQQKITNLFSEAADLHHKESLASRRNPVEAARLLEQAQEREKKAEALEPQIRKDIRAAYARTINKKGGHVLLSNFRKELGNKYPRADVDEALRQMRRDDKRVELIPESNQKVLSAADWEAALEFGNQKKHLIRIVGVPPAEKAGGSEVLKAAPAKSMPTLDQIMKDAGVDSKLLRTQRGRILDDVTKDLADPKKTPAAVGRDLEKTAKGIRSSAALQFGGHITRAEDRGARASYLADLKSKHDAWNHEASELEKLGKALQKVRRPAGTKAPAAPKTPAKAAPVKAVRDLQASEELKQTVAKTSIADLRRQADAEGIKVPASAKTKQAVMDHIVQEMAKRELARRGAERATRPAKAAEPAKVTKAAPTAPSTTGKIREGVFSVKPLTENTWGGGGGSIHYHPDGQIGRTIRSLGQDQHLDVNGEPLADVLGKLATDAVSDRKSSEEVAAEIGKLAGRMPEGSKAARALEELSKNLEAPKRSINIPEKTPPPLRELAHKLEKVPLARREKDELGRQLPEGELTSLAGLLSQIESGALSPTSPRVESALRDLMGRHHESQEGQMEIRRAIIKAMESLRNWQREERKKR